MSSDDMAVAKSGTGGNEERKSSEKMSGEKAPGLRSIHKASLTDQCKNKIVKVRHYACTIADGKANGVFTERNIPPIMGACFNTPMESVAE